jgi:hypothetical protein
MSTLNGGPGNIVTNGLVLYLDAANYLSYTSGSTTWNDLSGNNNSGSLVNGPTFSSGNAGSIVFDGTNDYVNCGYSTVVNPPNNLTFSQWVVRTVDDNGIRNPIEMADGISDELYFVLFRGDLSPKRWQFGIRQSNNTYVEPQITGYLNLNQWYQLTLVANANDNTLKIYVNGIIDTSATATTYNGTLKVNPAASLYIGADPNRGRFFRGNISQTSIYNRALTASEVLQNYNATKARFGL